MVFVLVPGAWTGAWVWDDVVNFLESSGFPQVVLVGHSYSGLVVGQVAAQVPFSNQSTLSCWLRKWWVIQGERLPILL